MYAELRCRTHYSFLRGASSAAELIGRAIELDIPALAITDRNGVYGLPKAYLAIREHEKKSQKKSIHLLCGAELTLTELPSISFIAKNRAGYGLLCRILTASHADKEKGQATLTWKELLSFLEKPESNGLFAIPSEDLFAQTPWDWGALGELFEERLLIPLSRLLDGHDEARTQWALSLQERFSGRFPRIIATNDVHYHTPDRRRLQDVMACIRETVPIANAGSTLFSNGERYLKSPKQMTALFRDIPNALSNTLDVARSCTFSLSELRYRYPSEWIPKGFTAQSHLENLTWQGARGRYPEGIPARIEAQLKHELALIEQLQFADYFLTIWEIVDYARSRDILCQGRGSAANSSVCYCLGITAVDPSQMQLLFERFISAERGEPPDIDVDFEHERREEVIQHIYEKYGRDRAAMVSAVITYRSRSAIREITKVFGNEQDKRDFLKNPDPQIYSLTQELQDFPRHLSIHSGGFTLSADPIIETVPVEPARMEGRTIIQWDKYDLDILGLLKVDILALGMLTALQKCMKLVHTPLRPISLALIPQDDPATYEMIQKADTIGLFQIESRAQMSMLPRLLPKNFYDLVIEVALVRPGPIHGDMVHPYLRRRRGLEPATPPHPKLQEILGRTLGVPLFQEQVMKMAMVMADFSAGEADELRRAIGAWRSSGAIDQLGERLVQGLRANGIPKEYTDMILRQIHGFSEYGFPESHAASFAHIAYVSAYLKCHFPGPYTCALLNSQPMGFYAAHTLIDDAKRHGVTVLPLHPNFSEWDYTMEGDAIRVGFRSVFGLSRREADALLQARRETPFRTLPDFLARTRIRPGVLARLALGDAFSCFEVHQREALWQILGEEALLKQSLLGQAGEQLELFAYAATSEEIPPPSDAHTDQANAPVAFKPLDEYGEMRADYAAYGFSTRGHPMQIIRKRLPPTLARASTRIARELPHGSVTTVPGISIVMQRPPTAKGTVFATLEDEFGFLDLVFHKAVFEKFQEMILDFCFLKVRGRIQRDGNSLSMLVQRLEPLPHISMSVHPSLSEGVRG